MKWLRRWLAELRHGMALACYGESPRTFFDIHDDDLLQRLLNRHVAANHDDWSAILAYTARPDLWQAYPLALTPAGRRDFLLWCARHGAEWGATVGSAVAGLRWLDARPDRGLVHSYRFRPEWQRRFPNALTLQGWPVFRSWVATEYHCAGTWLKRATLDASDIAVSVDSDTDGVNIIALWRYVSGLREVAMQYETALLVVGLDVARRALPSPPNMGTHTHRGDDALEVHPISILVSGAVQPFDDLYTQCGLHPRAGVYRIASWAWELEDLPAEVMAHATLANEFWALSEFGAIGIRKLVTDRPVIAMPPAVSLPVVQPLPRSHFGLPDGVTLFLFTFDLSSILERKNPLGLIEAFRRAFRFDEPAQLVLKVNRAESYPFEFARIQEAMRGVRGTILTGVFSRDDLTALMMCCDSVVSLHRSEGFGYTVAEAMWLGKPVIATDYSATAEYLTPEVGLPVRCQKVRIEHDHGPYLAGMSWAEPDLDHAAEQMRFVLAQPEAAAQLGDRAAAFAQQRFSLDALSQRLVTRLNEIRHGQ